MKRYDRSVFQRSTHIFHMILVILLISQTKIFIYCRYQSTPAKVIILQLSYYIFQHYLSSNSLKIHHIKKVSNKRYIFCTHTYKICNNQWVIRSSIRASCTG